MATEEHMTPDLITIDPGMAISGWAAFRDSQLMVCGSIRAPASLRQQPDFRRRSWMVSKLLEQPEVAGARITARHGRAVFVVEGTGKAGVFKGRSPVGMKSADATVGALLDRLRDVDRIEVHPRNSWAGGRSNSRVRMEMRMFTGNPKLSIDASDAVGLGLWWIGQEKLRKAALNV